jgi:hypothetical protein
MTPTALKPSAIERVFLGWDRLALPEAARRLVERYRDGAALDLEHVIVVVPGQRAGRRLQELLAYQAEDKKLRFTPAQVVTEGSLAEMLYPPKRPFASELVQDLAWAQALRDLPGVLREKVTPHPPDSGDVVRWMELGNVMRRLHLELAADGLDFAAVRARAPQLETFNETERWDALIALQQRYLALVDAQELWDKQTARLKAIEFREIATECDIILLATVDLNDTLRKMLGQVAERVTAFVVAPKELEDLFDEYGCLIPEKWREAEIPLRDEQLCRGEGPVEQADAVGDWLAELGGRYRVDEVTIGVPDEALVPQLQRQLKQSGVEARWVEGVRIGESAPYRLLAAAVEFTGGRRYEDLAALIRHTDVEDFLADAAISLPAQLDGFYNAQLPSYIRQDQALKKDKDWPDLARALERVNGWLAEAESKRPLREWGDVFRKILGDIYGSRTLDLESQPQDGVLLRTVRRILDACDGVEEIPDALAAASLTAAEAFKLALGPLKDEALPPPADPDAVEILGWLELPLDDSKALVVTSFNEGIVPKSAGADAFLPDRLRKELRLEHNERRYARDAYATSVLCHSREELRVLFARKTRRDAQDNPLQPSRLIFACSDVDLVRRARSYFGERPRPNVQRPLMLAPRGPILEKSLFAPPKPVSPKETFKKISVTRFKEYLACPYRYYLRHIERLKAVEDGARELDARAFGNLIHYALSDFGRDPASPSRSSREEEIFDFLSDRLNAIVQVLFGAEAHRPSIRLQLEQARDRLRAFAGHQAALVSDGWRLIHVENAQDRREQLSVPFPVDGVDILLNGRIDRMDFHDAKRKLLILDYKTAESGENPDTTHRKSGHWIDLQLPLYRYLWQAARLDVPANIDVELGYFNLPKNLDEAGVAIADWDQATLESAKFKAEEVIRNLRRHTFLPMADPPPKYSEDFAAICLDNVLERPRRTNSDEGGKQ